MQPKQLKLKTCLYKKEIIYKLLYIYIQPYFCRSQNGIKSQNMYASPLPTYFSRSQSPTTFSRYATLALPPPTLVKAASRSWTSSLRWSSSFIRGLARNGDELVGDGGNRTPGGENRDEASQTYLIWEG
jgi:hypothetical protein